MRCFLDLVKQTAQDLAWEEREIWFGDLEQEERLRYLEKAKDKLQEAGVLTKVGGKG